LDGIFQLIADSVFDSLKALVGCVNAIWQSDNLALSNLKQEYDIPCDFCRAPFGMCHRYAPFVIRLISASVSFRR
jgi:hypothetical protein